MEEIPIILLKPFKTKSKKKNRRTKASLEKPQEFGAFFRYVDKILHKYCKPWNYQVLEIF